jgi:hypothetical protein
MLRAYVVGIDAADSGFGWDDAVIVAAASEKEAFAASGFERRTGGPVDYGVKLAPTLNRFVTEAMEEPQILLLSDVQFREAGWRLDDETMCAACRLFPHGLPEFAVCLACGHSVECTRAEGSAAHADPT